MATLASLAVKLGIDPKEFTGGLAKARTSLRAFQDDVERSRRTVTTLGGALTSIGKVPTLAGLAGSAVALVGAVKPAVGAMWLLPGAAMVGAAAASTLKVGLSGVSDAFSALADGDAEKAAEAMAKLHPAAQAFVKSGDAIRVKFEAVKKSVQGKLFAGLAEDVTALGNRYLPVLDTGMGKTATSLNGLARAAAGAMNTPFMQGVAAQVFDTTAASLGAFAPATGPMVTALGQIVKAGLPFIEQFAKWSAGALQAKAAFIGSAEGATWLQTKITAGVATIQQLLRIVGNLSTALNGLFTASGASGGSLLDTIERLTASFARWTASAQGQETLRTLFQSLVSITESLLVIIPQVAGALGVIAGIFASLPGPVQSVVGSFLGWSLVLGPIISRLAPLVALVLRIGPSLLTGGLAVARFALTLGSMGLAAGRAVVATTVAAAQIAARWVAMAVAATAQAVRVAAAWLLTAGTNAATAIATMVANAARYVAQWVIMAAGAAANAARTALAWVLVNGAAAATAVAGMVANAARIIAQWVLMAAGAMARAAIMAAAWLIAMGPVGWVIAAVVALVALIIANWDTVKNATIAAWNAVSQWVSNAWNTIVSTVSGWIAKAVTFVVNGWNNAKTATTNAWSSLVSTVQSWIGRVLAFVGALPGRILSALASLGSLLVGLGGDLVQGLWRGIQAGWSWLTGAVGDLARGLLNAAKAALGIASPSKLFNRLVGRWIPAGVGKGVTAGTSQAVGAVQAMARRVADASRSTLMARVGAQLPQISGEVRANYGSMIADAGARTDAGGEGLVINVVVNNPKDERASDSIARELRDLSDMGAFAGRG